MEKSKQVLSKDVLDAELINSNIDDNPQKALTELARTLNINIQRAQLNDLNIATAIDICSMIKTSANITLAKWAMRSQSNSKKLNWNQR